MSFLIIETPDWVWEMIRKFFGDLLVGVTLLYLGLWAFRQQEKFKSSSAEVKNICEALAEFLKPYKELFYKTSIVGLPRLLEGLNNPEAFASRFVKSTKNIKQINLNLMKSIGPKPIEYKLPPKLEDVAILYESMSFLAPYSNDVVYSFLQIVEVMDGIIKGNPNYGEFELTNILKANSEARYKFGLVVLFIERVIHGGTHELYDWDKFSKILKRFKKVNAEITEIELIGSGRKTKRRYWYWPLLRRKGKK